MRDIYAHLPNLEILKVKVNDIVWEYFEGLGQLKHLKTLQLISPKFTDRNAYQPFMDMLGTLTSLEKLDLDIHMGFSSARKGGSRKKRNIWPDHGQLEALAAKLVHLKDFKIENYRLTEKTILKFIELAPQLTIFEFSDCGLELNPRLLQQIENIRIRQAKQRGDETLPINLFLDNDTYGRLDSGFCLTCDRLCLSVSDIDSDLDDYDIVSISTRDEFKGVIRI